MADNFEEKYEDVLHNIESAILTIYNQYPEMTDWNVEKVLDSLTRDYQQEASGRKSIPQTFTSQIDQELRKSVFEMCEWRLGRLNISRKTKVKTIDEIIACLKRIRLSQKRWSKEGGRRGYLDFIKKFV